ncbi:MAG: DedA family protein [Betaproteobacteria bacterium]|nr:DedA family protein [Betaproteobacteria bacterium]
MEWMPQLADLIMHVDRHLLEFVRDYGAWIYALLFIVIFCETGLVVTPFLPGDSLLFVAGALAATGEMNVHVLVLLLVLAAILGDSVNFGVGRWIGPRVFRMEDSWFFNRKHLERAHAFYERHGGKTIVLARFVPIVRTYAPFVAGVGAMDYRRFIAFNVGGALLWVVLLTYCGYVFGNIPFVKNNISKVLLGIIVLSVLPIVVEYLRARRASVQG